MQNDDAVESGKSLRGHLLIAAPQLLDPNFARTVVLLIQHGSDGAFGLVLNRPTDKCVKDIWSELSETPCDSELPLYFGGPVPGPLMAIHSRESLGDAEILPGVFFSVGSDKLEQLVREETERVKILVGHAGWSGGQLEGELEGGGWLTLPAKPEHVFRDYELWDEVTKQVANTLLAPAIKTKHVPKDPSMN
jgi:putative transcriptional regulator